MWTGVTDDCMTQNGDDSVRIEKGSSRTRRLFAKLGIESARHRREREQSSGKS